MLRTMREAGLGLDQVWFHYFSLGGDAGMFEVEAFLHHALRLPQLQRDMLAHAVNELIRFSPPLRAPYSSDITDETSQERNGDDQPH